MERLPGVVLAHDRGRPERGDRRDPGLRLVAPGIPCRRRHRGRRGRPRGLPGPPRSRLRGLVPQLHDLAGRTGPLRADGRGDPRGRGRRQARPALVLARGRARGPRLPPVRRHRAHPDRPRRPPVTVPGGTRQDDAKQDDTGQATAGAVDGFDHLIHAPARLRICATLDPVREIEFGTLLTLLDLSKSVLSKHLSVLADAGYVTQRRAVRDTRQRVWVRLTDTGRTAYQGHVAALRRIVDH